MSRRNHAPRASDSEREVGRQPFSPNSVRKGPRIRDAVAVTSVCPYCAVGCSQKVYVKSGKIIDIEGNYDSPINEGTLCPKGANTFQLTVNPHRMRMYQCVTTGINLLLSLLSHWRV